MKSNILFLRNIKIIEWGSSWSYCPQQRSRFR